MEVCALTLRETTEEVWLFAPYPKRESGINYTYLKSILKLPSSQFIHPQRQPYILRVVTILVGGFNTPLLLCTSQ